MGLVYKAEDLKLGAPGGAEIFCPRSWPVIRLP